MKAGLFIDAQSPGGFNLAERVPELVAQRVVPVVPASLADPSDADAADYACHRLRHGAGAVGLSTHRKFDVIFSQARSQPRRKGGRDRC
jgi:hypothetical protein